MRDRSRHVDGVVDVRLDQSCTSCHGGSNPAPPVNVDGENAVSARGVGAHQTHMLGTVRARAVPCAECHQVPKDILSPGHTDTPPPAEVALTGTASAFGPGATYQNGSCANTSCHGAVFPDGNASGGTLTTPSWYTVDGTQAACGTCHALPPPRPHPYYAEDCGRCHKNMSPDGKTFLRPELHVDGIVTFELP
jgi:predicted CxxxxCH...CXXCH cytochrome family protein